MALIQQSGLARLTTRYYNSVRAVWRAVRAGWKAAREKYSQHYSEYDRPATDRSAHKKAGRTFSRYLKNYDGQSSLRPLTSAMMQHEQIEKYERELLAAFNTEEQPETRNIAISGAVGVGKSSFIHTFTERNPQFKYTRIFLPAQSEINASTAPDNNDDEKALLEQLLCNITGKRSDDIKVEQPQSRGWRKVIGLLVALLTSYSIATLGYISGSLGIDQSTTVKALHQHLPDQMLAFTKKYAPLLAELSLFLVATLLILYLFSGLQKLLTGQRSRLIRLEKSADKSDSGNYLHQITHAFARSRHDVVIVENLTSPCQLAALKTLYRINGYLNGSGHLKQPVYFVYVLADEMLTARERTRFFDLIIPIIPALNTKNAGPKLYRQLKTINCSGQDVADQMDKALIYNVAISIDDMKLMTNIVNEFHMYLEQFSSNHRELNKNKLFSMVAIKNLYPKEHAELTNDMGIFWRVFNDNKLPGTTVAETLHQGIMGDSVLRELTEERFGPVLYLLMNGYLAEDYRDYLFYCYPDTPPHEYQATSWQPVAPPPQPLKYQVSNVSQKSSHLDDGYLCEGPPHRFQVATDRQVNKSLEAWRYQEPEVNEYNPPGNSLQVGRNISESDRQLYLQLKEGLVADFQQNVDSPENLLHLLSPSDLANGQGLINAVVNHLLEKPSTKYNGHSAHRFLRTLFNLSEEHIPRLQDFIYQYFQSKQKHKNKLFVAFFSINQKLLIHCLTNDHSGDIMQAKLIARVLPILISEDHDNLSKAIIPSIAGLTDIRPIVRLVNEQPGIWAWLKKHQVKFGRLSLRHCTQRIAFRIIEDSMYKLNSHMMGLLLAFTAEERPTALAHISYSALCSCGHHRLICQIHENLNEFVTNLLLVQPRLKEDQSYLVELLNSPVLEANDKIQLLRQSRQKLVSIRETLDYSLSLSAQLLEQNLVAASWANILHICKLNQKSSLNPLLIKFIAIPENTEKLALHPLPNNQNTFNLLLALIHSKDIHNATLNQLLSAFPAFYLEHLNLKYISQGRIEVISQHPRCQFSFKSLEWLAKNEAHFKADNTFYYLLRFWNEYKTKAVSTAQLTVNTIVKLLSSSKIKVDDKLWLCNLLNHENEIDARILTAMLSPITSQPAESFAMKIRFSRLETLIATARILPEKVRLLSQQVKYLSRREVLTLLSRLDIESTGQLMQENNQFSLSGTRENIELIKALKRAYHIEAVVDKKEKRIRAYIKQSSPQSIR